MQSYWMTTFSVAGPAVRAAVGGARAGAARAGGAAAKPAAMPGPLAIAAPMARPAARRAPALATLETWRAAGPIAVGILWQCGGRKLAGSPARTAAPAARAYGAAVRLTLLRRREV